MSDGTPPEPAAPVPAISEEVASPPSPPDGTIPDVIDVERDFEAEGVQWIARLAGNGALGTGAYGLALVEAVHFCDARAPDRPVREALLARGRFHGLFDSELVDLLARATPIVSTDER